MIKIIHRINTIEELKKIPEEYGVEVDIRAFGDKLILNHEPHEGGDDFREYLKSYKHSFIILNIKEAGIEEEVITLMEEFGIQDYFLLDVEYPFIYKTTRQMKFKKVAVRFSEAEPIEFALAHKGMLDFVWVDTNTKLPLDKEAYKKLKEAGFKIFLVCPERWGRPQDIPEYKNVMEKEGMELDGIMTSIQHVGEW